MFWFIAFIDSKFYVQRSRGEFNEMDCACKGSLSGLDITVEYPTDRLGIIVLPLESL